MESTYDVTVKTNKGIKRGTVKATSPANAKMVMLGKIWQFPGWESVHIHHPSNGCFDVKFSIND